jgi:hypothetical protein
MTATGTQVSWSFSIELSIFSPGDSNSIAAIALVLQRTFISNL